MNSWQDVTLGREDRDTVFAEYIHTARQYGQHQQQRMERIGAEALTEMAIDSVSAPIIMGQLVRQALLGDAESQALLQAMGQEIKAFAANPLNYITESNREQLAQADALELPGQPDEADRLRVRVALENQSMLMGAGGLAASLPSMARNVATGRSGMAGTGDFSRGRAQDDVVVSDKIVSIDTLPIQPSRDIPAWAGSGPQEGVLGVNPASHSTGALQNFTTNKGGVEFIFDPTTSTFLVKGNSYPGKHSLLAQSIDAPTDQVVGGILTRSENGAFITNEASGHFWQNWTPELRENFVETMSQYGLNVRHSEGM
ncbi:polymorphic toxin type 43 domain-containing protein [Halomonas sp. Mc5H-6]|uniref:polymorphic toxin type 43 domain-containing protein n=1 Tax=Halomonas sp. Mc5H-6 TaxID=2954500 RepID=UPI0020983430|nr:polymorphic toxin type 43 domain-containing protein [Halomonas sp. Mc5H-6]MCO7246030.1 polymorphic toxin type 43 domain-containing protein [Halomonas sp. Mc5H-6]